MIFRLASKTAEKWRSYILDIEPNAAHNMAEKLAQIAQRIVVEILWVASFRLTHAGGHPLRGSGRIEQF
jgi:hypothetical protein